MSSKIGTGAFENIEATKHICHLPEEEPLLIMYISTGYCVALRRYFRKKTLVNPKNKRAKKLYLSAAAFKKEMENQMKRYYYMIHPYSQLKAGWETFMVIVVIASLFYYPTLVYADKRTHHVINAFLFVVFLLDIFVNFDSGYFSSNANKVVLDRRRVSVHYVKTWFFVDFICLLNINKFLVTQAVCTVLNYVSILRINMIVRYLPGFTQTTQIIFYRFHLTKLVMITLIIVWWATSFMYLLASIYEEPWLNDTTKHGKVITCLYRVTYLIFLIGFGETYSTSDMVIIFEIICWMVGTVLKIFCFAEVMQIVIKYMSGRNMYHQRMQRLKRMMRTKRLPLQTRSRIFQYFDFCFQKNYFKEEEILKCFSTQLKAQVLGYNSRKLLDSSDIFDDLPHNVTEKLVLQMKPVIFLRHDIIVQEGSEGGSMFFVHDGAVAVYSAEGVEICHISDGECFGERAMIIKDTRRLATVVAIDACELYVLYSKDFEKSLEVDEDLLQKMRRTVTEKYEELLASENQKMYTM